MRKEGKRNGKREEGQSGKMKVEEETTQHEEGREKRKKERN